MDESEGIRYAIVSDGDGHDYVIEVDHRDGRIIIRSCLDMWRTVDALAVTEREAHG